MTRRAFTLAAGLVLASLALVSCGPDGRQETTGDRAAAGCERLLTLAPNLTELAFALGLGDRVVGVSDYSRWPAEAARLPRVGGLFDPSFEAMVALQPDLAVALPSEEDVAAKLRAVEVDVLTLSIESLDDVAAAGRTFARRCGVAEAGEELARDLERRLAPPDRPPLSGETVALVVGRPPGRLADLYLAGPGTFLDELIRRLGGENAFADSGVRYPQVSPEEILAREPDWIVELHGEPVDDERRRAQAADWQRFPQLPAVREGRVVVLGADYALVPGPRLPLLYQRLAEELAG